MLQLRRLHIHLSRTASHIVDGLPPSEVFPRLGESLALGRADLLLAQWLLARPEIVTALRGGDWMQASPEAAVAWATFWHDDIARYFVAYEEVAHTRLVHVG